MNAREMQIEFERRITLINSDFEIKEKPTSDTIFSFLNAYTERFVKANYLQEDNVQDNTRAQKKNADSLKGLIVRTTLKDQLFDEENTDCNTSKFELPEDYFLYIRSNSKVTSTYKGEIDENDFLSILPNKTIKEEDIDKILSTAFNKAILRTPYVVLNAGMANDYSEKCYLNVIHDSYTNISSVDIVYYRKPKRFDVIGVDDETILDHCELPENVHMEIVEGAVEMFITEAKYRLSVNKSNNEQ